jgi:hypothetical protein
MRAQAYPGEDPNTLPSPEAVASQLVEMAAPRFGDNGATWAYHGKGLTKVSP